jgi:hypothetical protein
MKHIILTIFFAIALAPATLLAQSAHGIQSKEDYEKIKASINTLSQKLYGYAQQYPAYAFEAAYNPEGKVVEMHVSGVANADDAKQISIYLLELENLGELVRTMDYNHLPDSNEKTENTRLSEIEALEYKPLFNTVDGMSSTKGK